MNIDLSFTQDSQWIAKRKKAWEAIEDQVADELTKKQVEARKKYFFTGTKPKVDMSPGEYTLYFPDNSYAGLSFVFKEYVDIKRLRSRVFKSIQSDFFQNLAHWPGASLEDKIRLFKMVYGDTFDPDRKFPFLIGSEAERRPLSHGVDELFVIITGKYLAISGTALEESFFWKDLVDFYLSLFEFVEPSIWLPDFGGKNTDDEYGRFPIGELRRWLDNLAKNLINPSLEILNSENYEIRKPCINKLKAFFEGADSPPELVAYWQWAKQEYSQ